MDALLNELKLIPGVMGSFVHSNTKGVVGSNLPTLFRKEALKQVGALLGRVLKLSETTGIEISSFEVKYEEAMLLVKQIDKDACFIIVCEPGISMPLINMSTSMLIPELKSAVINAQASPAESAAPVKKTASAAVSSPDVDPDKLMTEGPLAPALKEIKIQLARSIGPIANLVMSDCLESWCQQGAPGKNRLKDLVKILAAEIGDRDLEAKFYNEIKHLV